MRAVLLVPDTERIGLTGKPLINKQGIVGSLKGSFSAGQRVTLINLRGISQKIAEAQQAISGADDNIRRSGETIDDIKKKNNDLATRLNDYWTRWDNKGVHDEYADLQFIGTAMSMDKVRTAMLGESVDPYPFYEDLILPRGMYWDPVFAWKKHSLEFNKDRSFVNTYSTRGWWSKNVLSLSGLLSNTALDVGKVVAVIALNYAFFPIAHSIQNAVVTKANSPWVGSVSQGASTGSISVINNSNFGFATDIGLYSGAVVIMVAAIAAIKAAIGVLTTKMRDYNHVELMGSNASCYEGSPIQEDTLYESWFTYAYVDSVVKILFSQLFNYAIRPLTKAAAMFAAAIAALGASYAAISVASSLPDLYVEGAPVVNPAVVTAANMAATMMLAAYKAFNKVPQTLYENIIPSLVALGASLGIAFTFNVTRTNTNPVAPINDFNPTHYGPSRSPKPFGSYNDIGDMNNIPLDGWMDTVGSLMSAFSPLGAAAGLVTEGLTSMAGIGKSETAAEACSGGPTRYDSYVASIPHKPYIDWWNNRVNVQGWTANINNVAGVGQNTQTFYGKLSPRTGVVNYYSMYVRTKSPIYFRGEDIGLVECSVTFNGITYDNIKIKVNSRTPWCIYIPFDPNDKTTPIKNGYSYWALNVTKNNSSSSGTEIEGHTDPGIMSGTASEGKLVCWSHVFNKNILNIKPKQIGNRTIEKTIVIKTRYEFGIGIYRACQVLCKCVGSDNLYLLLERDMQRFYSGNNADIMMIEQVIYNFDPENYGDFFTGHRGGKISEVFAYTFDGHIISYRPNMEWKDNYLLGDFVNREVTHFDKFYYKSIAPSNSSEGHIDSYENVYR